MTRIKAYEEWILKTHLNPSYREAFNAGWSYAKREYELAKAKEEVAYAAQQK